MAPNDMERAVYVGNFDDVRDVIGKYTRVYFGSETCEHLIPLPNDVEKILGLLKENGLRFTFNTPYVTDVGVDKLRKLFGIIERLDPEAEVTINDWGMLPVLKDEFGLRHINLGRILAQQTRDPQIVKYSDGLSSTMFRSYQEAKVDNVAWHDFLEEMGILRVELDNLLQGVYRASKKVVASLYYPSLLVSATRFCPISLRDKQESFLRSIPKKCSQPCLKSRTYVLRHQDMGVPLQLRGNRILAQNEVLPKDLNDLHVDRLVYVPNV